NADERVTDCGEAACGQPRGIVSGGVVQRREHDVEPCEHGVLEIQSAVLQDVDLDTVQNRHAGKAIPQRVDLVSLTLDLLDRKRAWRRGSPRMIRDRDVLVADRMARLAHRARWIVAAAIA